MDITIHDTTLQIHRLDARRVKDLELLHTAVYGQPPEKGMYPKKYDTAFTGQAYLGFIAYASDGTPAAYYGVIPCFISYGDKTLLAAQSADTMTHPLHRKKGLFILLARQTYDLCRQVGVRLLFGFPNQNSYHTFVNSLGWTATDRMDLFILPVRYALPFSVIRNSHAQTGIPNSVQNEGFGGVHRDEAYLRYKTYRPSVVKKAGGACVWFRAGASLLVGDVTFKPEQWDAMIAALMKRARLLASKSISFQACPGTLLHTQLFQRYTPQPSFPIITMDLDAGIPMGQLKFTFADIDIF